MSQRASRFIFAVISGLFALTGCSSHRQLATQAVGFNLTVEKAQNEMLLLNVIRAKDRLPMYMTGISSLSGNVQTAFSTGVGGSYTRSKGVLDTLTRGITSSVGASLSTNPSFSLAVLDTQEFMQGFLRPVEKGMLAYYWNQGWPPDLLLYLLIHRVEIQSSTGGPPQVIRNYPDSEDPELREVRRFGCVLRGFLAQKPRIEELEAPEDIGPSLSEEAVSNVASLMQVASGGMLLAKVPGKVSGKDAYQFRRMRIDLQFKLDDPKRIDCEGLSFDLSGGVQPSDQPLAKNQIRVQMGSTTLTLFLRSPEGLVYYLGELMRFANRQESPKVPYLCIQGRLQPIFVALPAGRCSDTLVDADAGRGGFSVPSASLLDASAMGPCEEGEIRLEDVKCESGRSMQALRLLSQLMSLQKSAKDAPSTAVVRVLN